VGRPARSPHVVIVGVDTGGTFTDLVGLDERGALVTAKVPSTPGDPSRAVVLGLREISAGGGRPSVVHGTTVGTNALLERKVARTALVTTAGFRDVLEIGRQDRPALYDLRVVRPEPLVPAARRFEANERVGRGGSVIAPLRGLEALRRRVEASRPEAVAISLLFSFANPAHEIAIERALGRMGVPVTRSSDVLPEYREFERTSTTVANAALRPVLERYVRALARKLGGKTRLRILQSNGGLFSAAAAARYPVHTVFSGPAGGVIGATRVARAAGFDRIITFDMGGTSTDVALVDGEPRLTTDFSIGGLPIRVPVVDIHTVGAGGGSIARIDAAGALRVGPSSAGADPGPAAYGKGDAATVTDAHVALGRIDPEAFLGGRMPLDPARARAAIARLAREGGLSPRRAAEGVIDVANAAMGRALQVISVNRGHDPALFTLVAFGGAGGLHAVDLARSLSIRRVLVPRDPGLLSALGLLLADAARESSSTVLARAEDAPPARLRKRLRPLVSAARRALRAEGVPAGAIRFRPSLDLRYAGQSFEVNVPWDGRSEYEAAFHAAHEKAFGTSNARFGVEVVAVRLRAEGRLRDVRLEAPRAPRGGRRRGRAPSLTRDVAFAEGPRKARIYRRDALVPGDRISGPAVVTEMSATTLVPPGARAEVERDGHLVIETEARA